MAKNANVEIFEALALFEKERGIPIEYMIEKIAGAIQVAVKKGHGGNDDIIINIDPITNTFDVLIRKTVTDDVLDPDREILPEDAIRYDKRAVIGEKVSIKLETKEFGRIAAQTAKHVIRQGIREVERGQVLQEFQSKNQELVSATVERVDERTGAATIRIGKAEAVLTKNEQVGDEILREGDQIKVFIVDVKETEKGPKAIISRSHPGLVKRLFENEVPEIFDGTVQIKSISREAGSRTKLAVYSEDPNVDPVGACIGARGARVNKIVSELGGEKIDIIQFSEDPIEFISGALSPAKVISAEIDPEAQKSCRVTVPDGQISLAIGNKGQNARLAAKLTGWKIDIRPESGFFGEE
ncbi:MAG: transcription termination factor NusA [Oscillospiraceae bacterium]|jgi:N utilization substance protein A|nr:transcription termination factor NusA [Oscillospiraceae bacterium]